MMIAILIFSIIIVIVVIVKWPIAGGISVYKLLIDAFYFFIIMFLCGISSMIGTVDNMNVDLHPSESIRGITIMVVIISVSFYTMSQLPLIFAKSILKRCKRIIYIVEGVLYLSLMGFLIVGRINWAYSQCPEEYRPANELVRRINNYNETHSDRCSDLGMLGLKNVDDSTFIYKHQLYVLNDDGNEFTLHFKPKKTIMNDPSMLYSSETDKWDYVWD